MKRQDYISGDKGKRIEEPAIAPRQIWNSLKKSDFGKGEIEYSIFVRFKHPHSGMWLVNITIPKSEYCVVETMGVTIELSEETILKGYEFFQLKEKSDTFGDFNIGSGTFGPIMGDTTITTSTAGSTETYANLPSL